MATDTLTHATAHAHEHGHHDAGVTKIFGFWIYLMSDCILFSILFATYAVLVNGTAGGPTGKDIFELPFVLVETFLLLFSSITYGMAAIAMYKNNKSQVISWLALTWLFGAGFIGMEIYEFHHLIVNGMGPDRSGFLSAFFALVGTHGLHVYIRPFNFPSLIVMNTYNHFVRHVNPLKFLTDWQIIFNDSSL